MKLNRGISIEIRGVFGKYVDKCNRMRIKYTRQMKFCINDFELLVRLGYCFPPYQRLRLYNGAPFSRLLRHAGDTEDVFSA